jgi:hypothetical protein
MLMTGAQGRLTAGSVLGRLTIFDIGGMGPPVRRVALGLVVVAGLALAAGVVQLPRPVPTLSVQARLPAILVVSGAAPALPWPGSGEAGVDLPGVGTLANSGSDHPVPMANLACLRDAS